MWTCVVPFRWRPPRQEVPKVDRRLRQPSVRARSRSVLVRAHTVAPVSGASHTRAAVFTSSPQSVEIYERGAWWPGSMLGWRHDSRGRCQAWVRVEFAGVVEDAWVDLALLRLPESRAERHLTLTRQPKGADAVACSERGTVPPAAQGSDVTQTQ